MSAKAAGDMRQRKFMLERSQGRNVYFWKRGLQLSNIDIARYINVFFCKNGAQNQKNAFKFLDRLVEPCRWARTLNSPRRSWLYIYFLKEIPYTNTQNII